MDLDTDRYFEPSGLRQFATAVLTQHQAKHPKPSDAAWTIYRNDPVLCDRLADVIAARANRNYLVAAMAAVRLSTAERPVDPTAAGFDPASIPTGVGEALGKFLDQLAEPQRPSIRALLTALAYARGGGIDDRTWRAFAEALGYPVTTADLDQLRSSTGADYLVQTVTDDEGPLTRLFHQALAEELLAGRHQPSDERAALSALRPVPGTSWARVSAYALTHAADHASGARQLVSLLDDPDYLAHADLARLPSLLSLDADTAADPIAVVVRQLATRTSPLPPARRIRLLALTAAHFGLPDLRRRLAEACNQPFTPIWAHSLGVPHVELTGHTDIVTAVAFGRIGDRDIIVSGSSDNTVRTWDAATGRPHGEPMTGHTRMVAAVAFGRIGDCDIIVSGSLDETVRVWDAATGRPYSEPLTGHTGDVLAVAIGRIADRDIIVSGGWDATVRVWDAATGQPPRRAIDRPQWCVLAVAIGRIADRDIIVSGSNDKTVRVWDAATGRPRRAIHRPHRQGGGGSDRAHRRPRHHRLRQLGPHGTDMGRRHRPPPRRAIHRPHRLGGGGGDRAHRRPRHHRLRRPDSTVRIWDAATGRPHGEPFTGHTHRVEAVAIGRTGDRDIIVSGSWDRTVRIWDPANWPALPASR